MDICTVSYLNNLKIINATVVKTINVTVVKINKS